MKTTFVHLCVVMACALAIHLRVCVNGGELLVVYDVVDDPRASRVVSVLSASSERPVLKKLAEGVRWFDIARSGRFLMKDHAHEWFTGEVTSSLSIRKQSLCAVPNNITGTVAAISPDGTKIAWITTDTGKMSLIVKLYKDQSSKVLYHFSTNGIISAPAWSPDGKRIAFYYGPLEAMYKDGFSLMLLDFTLELIHPKEIAPPSLWTRLSPIRPTPPSWAPDGKNILFEARYHEAESPGRYYVVSHDAQRLVSSPFGTWSQDGKHIYTLRPGTTNSGVFVMSEINVLSENNIRDRHHLLLTGYPSVAAISPSGQKIAYVSERQIYLLDTTTGGATSYGAGTALARLIWIYPDGN